MVWYEKLLKKITIETYNNNKSHILELLFINFLYCFGNFFIKKRFF